MARNIVFDLAARFGAQGADMVAGSLDKIHKSTKNVMTGFRGVGEAFGHLQRAATGLAIIGSGVAGVLAKMGKDAMAFEAQMAVVASVVNPDGKAGASMKQLELLARKLGITTFSSATDAAKGMEVLAKAGFDATQVTQALPGVLALAATEEMKVEKAADIATKTMKAFGLQASEMTRVADVLAYVSMKTATDVKGLGAAMPYVAGQAKMLGMTYDETAIAMGLMTNAGIANTRAGTVLAAFLQHITGAARRGRKEIKQLGLQLTATANTTDKLTGKKIKKGEFIGFFPALQQIIDTYDKKGDDVVKRTMFFTRALGLQGVRMSSLIPGMRAYKDEYEKYIRVSAEIARGEITSSFAFQMASARFKSTKGAVTLLKNAFEGLSISLWNANIFTPKIAAGLLRVTQVVRTAAALLGNDPDKNDIVKKIGLHPDSVAKVQKVVDGIKRGINEFGLFIQDLYRKISEKLGKKVFGMDLEDIAAKVTKVVLTLGLLGPAIFALIPVVMVLGGVFQAFTSSLAMLIGPAGKILLLGAAIVWLIGKMASDKPQGFFDTMKTGFTELNSIATPLLSKMGTETKKFVDSLGEMGKLTEEVNRKHGLTTQALNQQATSWQTIKAGAMEFLEGVGIAILAFVGMVKNLAEGVVGLISGVGIAVWGLADMIGGVLSGNFELIVVGAKKLLFGLITAVTDTLLSLLQILAQLPEAGAKAMGFNLGWVKGLAKEKAGIRDWALGALNLGFDKEGRFQTPPQTEAEKLRNANNMGMARSFGGTGAQQTPGMGPMWKMMGHKSEESYMDSMLGKGAYAKMLADEKRREATSRPPLPAGFGTGEMLMMGPEPRSMLEVGTGEVRRAARSPRPAAAAAGGGDEMGSILAQQQGQIEAMATRLAKEHQTNIQLQTTNNFQVDGRVMQQVMQQYQINDAARSGGRPESKSASTPTVGLQGRQGTR
jgi:TP901 family phage tail tape measure protein